MNTNSLLIFLYLFTPHFIFCQSPPPESIITTHRRKVPSSCYSSYETILCYEKCQEDEKIGEILSKKHPDLMVFDDDDSIYLRALAIESGHAHRDKPFDYQTTQPGAGYPCRNKCETDPTYWTCLADCDDKDHTKYWTRCFSPVNGSGPLCPKTGSSYNLAQSSCLNCLMDATNERLPESCEFANAPNNTENVHLCKTLSNCQSGNAAAAAGPNGDINAVVTLCANSHSEDLEMARICLNDHVMVSQRDCCYSMSDYTSCGNDSYMCDLICSKILSPRLCREECKLIRNPTIRNCTENCKILHPTTNDTLCEHCNNGTAKMLEYKSTKDCINLCESVECVKSCVMKEGEDSTSIVEQICLNTDHTRRLARFGEEKYPEWIYFKPSGIHWLSKHFTPLECGTNNGSDWAACNEIVSKERTFVELEEKCKENPFRNVDMLACALQLNVSDFLLKGIMNALKYEKCEDKTVQLKLYKLTFAYEDSLCERFCRRESAFEMHPNHVAEMRCRIDQCQEPGRSPYCKPQESDVTMNLLAFSECRWKVDFAKAENPYYLWANYFNELGPATIMHKLKHPNTIHMLQMAEYHGRLNFYTFPYFLVIRGICDNDYYSDDIYKIIMMGGNPIVEMKYNPPSSRHYPKTQVMTIFHSALINLNRLVGNNSYMPENPRSLDGGNSKGCHERICYPAFTVPVVYLQVPIFHVSVNPQEVYPRLIRTIHVSPFHSRSVDGKGEIQIAIGDYPVHVGMLFPKDRSSFAEDMELNYYSDCYLNTAQNGSSSTGDDGVGRNSSKFTCPEIDHYLDHSIHPYQRNRFAPLDSEDIIRSQFTHGTSPTQAFAGFYDPRYLLIGDADFAHFEVVNWETLLLDLERKPNFHSCVQPSFTHRGFEKPIYSSLDNSDIIYPIKYYRQRYAAREYHTKLENIRSNDDLAKTSIFEAIGLEDRLLLVTGKGLVSFYGHTNATVFFDKTWTYNESEVLNRCFKIVRILPRAQPYSDSIVGITYDYKTMNYTKDGESIGEVNISQEIWIGKFVHPGEEIKWTQLHTKLQKSSDFELAETEEIHNDNVSETESREKNAKSEVEVICIKAFRTKIEPLTPSAFLPAPNETGWCEALDATPVQMKEFTVQLLVRMKILFVHSPTEKEFIYFYVLASSLIHHTTFDVAWTIDNLIPRIPCVYTHRESVVNVLPFGKTYFQKTKHGSNKNARGCHESNKFVLSHHVFLHGLTYTRTLSNHLFVYGSRLLQSSNKGESFIYLQSFPHHLQDFDNDGTTEKDPQLNRHAHRIIKMAFDDGGYFAFLTNKLELWLGSTGDLKQIRLRPSPLWHQIQLTISKVKNFNDGVPFSVSYDTAGGLYEMVAIHGEDGHVSRIMKRYVNEWKLLRYEKLLEKLKEKSKTMAEGAVTEAVSKPFNYDIAQFSSFCPFVSPRLTQNFSSANTRTQGMLFPRPDQHMLMGLSHVEGSLMAFQAATFALVWKTVFKLPHRTYAYKDEDPFLTWLRRKRSDAIVSVLRFTQGDPTEEDGVLVDPRKYKRLILETRVNNLLRQYFLDYNHIAELRLEFSIKNDIVMADYESSRDQIKQVQLNVENANGSIIQINTEKEVLASRAAVVFIIRLSVKRKSGLKQNYPGISLLPVPVTYHLIGAFGTCYQNRAKGIIGDKIETMAMVGCPTSHDFVFDWRSTQKSIIRGNKSEKEGRGMDPSMKAKCYGGEYICFFVRTPIVLHFKIFDESRQKYTPYDGKYVMKIIAGGRDRENMRIYKVDEIDAYNIPGTSDVSLIWNEWDSVNHHKTDRKPEILKDELEREIIRDSREIILDAGKSTIMWACHTLSPCSRIAPTSSFEVVFWFRVLITNKDIEPNTLCLYEKEFDILLYGFPPSPEIQLFMTLGFSFLIMSILYMLFVCCRRHERVWILTKSTCKNWFFIVKDAIPKKLRFYEPPLADENLNKTGRKNRDFGSHDLSHQDSRISVGMDSDGGSPKRIASSQSTLGSSSVSSSRATSSQVIPGHLPTHLAASSTKEAVYDQILTRRLNTIVEKNRAMRTNLLKKASIQMTPEDIETEEHFEMQFGRTVSQESVFTPPMPKDQKRGFELFF